MGLSRLRACAYREAYHDSVLPLLLMSERVDRSASETYRTNWTAYHDFWLWSANTEQIGKPLDHCLSTTWSDVTEVTIALARTLRQEGRD
jgi:hypothetical protein